MDITLVTLTWGKRNTDSIIVISSWNFNMGNQDQTEHQIPSSKHK